MNLKKKHLEQGVRLKHTVGPIWKIWTQSQDTFIEKKSFLRYNIEHLYMDPNRFGFNLNTEQAKINAQQ